MNDNILKKVEKPGRYTGGEWGQIVKDKAAVKTRVAFCFPDCYDIGMSNLGMKILYGVLNEEPDIWCERVFAPWSDMEALMRENNIPLYALESGDPLTDFDIVAFTLQYEMCYTNVLNMLELAGIPLFASERGDSFPLVIGGGPCTFNGEPVADFFDILLIGDGEEQLPALTKLYASHRDNGFDKKAFLRDASEKVTGVYAPSLYTVSYNDDGTIREYRDIDGGEAKTVHRAVVGDLDSMYFPAHPIVPFIETVQDRIMAEVFRGCKRGCRFCQAGMTSRPVREKSPQVLSEQIKASIANTGYDEVSLISLSISDYTRLPELCETLLEWTDPKSVSLSLPSMRVDSFTNELMQKISSVRSSGITFAPEAGTQRMRDVINKNLTEDDLLSGCRIAFENGKSGIKLYFMNGLPTETDEDIRGINSLAEKVVSEFYKCEHRPPKPPQVTISVACLVPKPFTPFQWLAQDMPAEVERKQLLLRDEVKSRRISYNYHDSRVGRIEAALARGNRRISKVLIQAHKLGMKFDSWDEYFSYDKWLAAFEAAGEDIAFFANRAIPESEVLPWDIIDVGVTKEFLLREYRRAVEEKTTPNCGQACSGCGANNICRYSGWEETGTWCPQTKK